MATRLVALLTTMAGSGSAQAQPGKLPKQPSGRVIPGVDKSQLAGLQARCLLAACIALAGFLVVMLPMLVLLGLFIAPAWVCLEVRRRSLCSAVEGDGAGAAVRGRQNTLQILQAGSGKWRMHCLRSFVMLGAGFVGLATCACAPLAKLPTWPG